ncbi:MAG: hypothetical protein C4531_06605, partial [Desulfurivibrio sp.]
AIEMQPKTSVPPCGVWPEDEMQDDHVILGQALMEGQGSRGWLRLPRAITRKVAAGKLQRIWQAARDYSSSRPAKK